MCILVLILISLASVYLVMKVNGKRTVSVGTVNNAFFKPKTYTIDITKLGFLPPELEINSGDTVIWKNEDSNTHTLAVEFQNITKPIILVMHKNYTYTFNKPGVYNYSCSRHPYKTGNVIVKGILG